MNNFRQWRVTSGGKILVSDENGKFHLAEEEQEDQD